MKATKIKNLRGFDAWKIKDLKPKPEVKEDAIESLGEQGNTIEDSGVQFNAGLYKDDDGKLLIIDKNGKYVKLDFDVDKLNLQNQKIREI